MSENKTIKTSDAKLKAIAKYDKVHAKSYTVKMNKGLFAIMEKAFNSDEVFKNQNSYTVQAIKEKLVRDGFMSEKEDFYM